jgi:hypothetical protein
MKFFRLAYIREMMIVLTGVSFLNMGFFLAEVAVLELDKCSKLVENLVNTGFEEERESESGDSSEEKVVDLMNPHSTEHAVVLLYSLPEKKFISPDPLWDTHYLEEFSPPPEG